MGQQNIVKAVEHRPLWAIVEVIAVTAAYIAISIAAVSTLDVSALFPDTWSSAQRGAGSSFLVGAVVQIVLVLFGACGVGLKDLQSAIARTVASSTSKGWTIAAIATAIHIGTASVAFIPQPDRIWHPSWMNLLLSAVPAADGWSQEVIFRGYVIFRLARAGIPPIAQVLLSGLLFSTIHIGYVGEGAWSMLSPLVGTFMLGCFFAWAVQAGRGSLLPVVVCHVVIIVALQPWLALAS